MDESQELTSISEAQALTQDERGEAIEAQRGERKLIGSFYLVNNDTQVIWETINPTLMDTDIFAACMSQLIINFMVQNPDASTVTIMAAVQRAMMDMAKQASQGDEE